MKVRRGYPEINVINVYARDSCDHAATKMTGMLWVDMNDVLSFVKTHKNLTVVETTEAAQSCNRRTFGKFFEADDT
jgi:hypothetical protein